MKTERTAIEDAWSVLDSAKQQFPQALAVVDLASKTSETAFTYSSLYSSSSQLANFLRAAGIQRLERVAVCLPNSQECLEVHFACAALHTVVVNLNTSLVARELAHILQVSSPRCIIAHTRYQGPVLEAIKQLDGSAGQVISL